MAEILLVNPSLRKGVQHMSRRMPAGLRRYWATHRRKNPHHRKHHRTRHHYRHNPFSVSGATGAAKSTVMDGVVGTVGALGNDFIYTYALQPYLPATLLSGTIGVAAAKLIGAVLIGMFGGKLWAGKGSAMAAGAATVALHDLAVNQFQAMGINLAGLGGVGAYMSYAPAVGSSGMGRLGRLGSTGRTVTQQLQRKTMGNLGAYMSRTGAKVPQRGMGAYMSGFGDTTFQNGIPTG